MTGTRCGAGISPAGEQPKRVATRRRATSKSGERENLSLPDSTTSLDCETKSPAISIDEAARIPLALHGPATAALQPMTVGIPLPKGAWHNVAGARVVTEKGRELVCQTEPLARWSDGSIQWLLLDFLVSADDRGAAFVVPDAAGADNLPVNRLPVDRGGVQVSEQPKAFIVDTGTARFQIARRQRQPMAQVGLPGAPDERAAELSVVLVDRRGLRREAKIEQMRFETRGSVRTTLLLEGSYPGCRGIKFRCRLCFFSGTGLLRVRFTLHNSNRARHRGGLWDLGDPGSFLFRGLSLELHTPGGAPAGIAWTAEPGQAEQTLDEGGLEIYQDSSGGENWQSRNHVNREGRVPCGFRGYRVRTPNGETAGLRASPVVAGGDNRLQWAAALPEFWQQFPKSLEWHDARLSIGLFPSHWDDLHELQGGEQKTHEAWLSFGAAGLISPHSLNWVHSPIRPRLDPAWVKRSAALPHFVAADDDCDPRLQSYLADVVRGTHSFFARREIIDEYGWRNYGDVYADHEAAYYRGPKPVISHYNNQFDIVYGALLQWLRTSDDAWFDLYSPLARHVADIDIYHTQQDRAAYNGGLFWFTDHYLDATTSTHRCYSVRNRPGSGAPYGGGPGAEHNFTTGLLYAYYVTGEPDFRAAVLELADWVVAMDDGARNILGLICSEPTGLASVCGGPHSAGPGRGAANSIAVLVDAWRLSGDQAYLAKAEALIRRCIHPADDVASRELLNIEQRWSYTMFLSSLAGYLHAKHAAERWDEMYAYARASLLHYARWMLDHERPYFDQAEQMEFPTEVWAAQEFRKANVLRLAASHAEGELREKFLQRAAALADRAWTDLLRFESRLTARAVAIVLTEGVRDQFFRSEIGPLLPEAAVAPHFGDPKPFCSQRTVVRESLTTVRGLAFVALNLLKPATWKKATFRL